MRPCSLRNKAALWLIALLAAAVLLTSASAQASYTPGEFGIARVNHINIRVQDTGFVEIEEGVDVNNTIVKIFTPKNIQDVLITDSKGNKLSYDFEDASGRQLMSFYLKSIDERAITILYRTADMTSKNASNWAFTFSATTTPGSTIVRVDFPQGTEVVSLEPGDILRSPKNLSKSMLLYPQVKDFTFEYGYKTNSLIPGGNDILSSILALFPAASSYLLPAAAILLIIIVLIYVFVVRRRLKRIETSIKEQTKAEEVKDEANLDMHERIERRMDKQMKAEGVKDEVKDVISGPEEVHDTSTEVSPIEEVTLAVGSKGRKIDASVLNMLDESERKVVELIENAEGEITQAYIYKSTGIPKASLSDLIKRLEKRNIIERRRDGRTNWINLQEWVFSE
jgi:uncharacterized membrane protein